MSGTSMGGGEKLNRYFPRMDTEVLLAYRLLSAPKSEARIVKSRTLGLGGLMFEADHPVELGSFFLLDLVLGELKLEVKAKVVYSNPVGPELYQNGFSFVDLTEDERERLTAFFLEEYENIPPDP